MTKGKPWPESGSEFILPDDVLDGMLVVSPLGVNSHAIAMVALCELHLVADRYYEAAGFRS